MSECLYVRIVKGILHFFNYNKIDNENGKNHLFLNTIDLLLALTYLSVSIWNLKPITNIVLLMNLLTLFRLIINNVKGSVNMRHKYEKVHLIKPGLLFKTAYDYKIIIETSVLFFMSIPFWIQGIIFNDYTIYSFAITVIILGFLENLINIFVELFEASTDI